MELIASTELENKVLGTAFVSNDALLKVVSLPDELFTASNRDVLSIFRDAQSKYSMIDLAILHSMSNGHFDRITELSTLSFTDADLDVHIAALKKVARKREIDIAIAEKNMDRLRILINEPEDNTQSITYTKEDLKKEIFEYYDKGSGCGLSTGWNTLDMYYNVSPKQLTIVTGIPFSGKSNWMDALMVNMAEKHDWRFAVFSPENQPVSRHIRSLVEKYTRMPLFPGYEDNLDRDDLELALNWVYDHFVIMNPNILNRRIDTVLNEVQAQIKERPVNGFVIDPWNELEHTRPYSLSETEYIGQSLMKMKQFSNKNNLHTWLVAHPTKLRKEEKSGKYPVPTLYDISGSANWRNKADNGIVVYRDFDTDAVTVYVQKIRFKDNGQIGKADLAYMKSTGRYV